MPTPLDGDIEQRGGLKLTSPDFDDGEQLPNWTGYANENENPQLEISSIPDDAESLVIILDDPDAEPVMGHVFDHWLVWDIDTDRNKIPRNWDAKKNGATIGYNDYVETGWGGPAPPKGSHTYKFKLLALADKVDAPAETRKARLGSMIYNQTEILGSTQFRGSYNAEQGTIF